MLATKGDTAMAAAVSLPAITFGKDRPRAHGKHKNQRDEL
jgi:hypothetical protein